MERKKIIYIFVAVLIIFLIAVEIISSLYLKKNNSELAPDVASVERVQTLNMVLRSYFGSNWPIVIGIMLSLIIVILLLFLFITKKNIEISDKTYKWVKIVEIIFIILISFIAVYGVHSIYKSQNRTVSTDENQQYLNNQKDALIKFFVSIVSLILLIILMLGGGYWGYKKIQKTKF